MFKNKKPLIKFISTVPGLEDMEDIMPKPSKFFIPSWWKDIPSNTIKTVKNCPSFPDFFSQGYVVPMWMDSIIGYDKDASSWSAQSAVTLPKWEIHHYDQFLKYADPNFKGSESNFIFKANCPWRIITPPGYSVLQLPLFYHFNKEYSVLPGVIDTDIHHEINQQVLYHSDKKEIIINRGDPFVLYVPFKRTKFNYSVSLQTEEEKDMFARQHLNFDSRILGGSYRKLQRDRDSKK